MVLKSNCDRNSLCATINVKEINVIIGCLLSPANRRRTAKRLLNIVRKF